MEELPLSMKQRTLSPVALLVSSKDLLEPFAALITAADPEKALDFERVGFEYNFPPKKDAKIFERYVTNGILKQTWVDKRKKSIPGVIVLIFDWSGVGTDYPSIDAYDWRTKEQLINKEIRRIKDQIKGRNIKLTVIILIRPNEEIDDKMNLIRRQNEIDTKAFFILNGGLEALRPHDKKLAKFLWETAIGHYKEEIERLKKLRSRASKEVMNGNGELPIRYNFKLGYISELRQDREGASNFYKKAYSELCSIGSTDVGHFLELRSVGDWIIYRQLCLQLSPPYNSIKVKEAVSIFKGHITKFRSHKFRSSLDFERYKWLCENYDRLGDLLEKLPYEPKDHDNLWWNPGFYFQVIFT
jgi:hypothetical protein